MEDISKNEITQAFMNLELVPYEVKSTVEFKEAIVLPFEDLLAMGSMFSSTAMTILNNIGQSTQKLYKAFTANGSPLNLPYRFKDGSGAISSYRDSSGALQQARFQEASQTSTALSNTTVIAIAAAVVIHSIMKKLDTIQETQQSIYGFLQDDKRADLKTNVDFLMDILKNYKFNWNNDLYRKNMHIKVLDIRQSAEQSIDFYRRQIARHFETKKFIITEHSTKEKLAKVQSDIEDYRTAVNLFSLASFVEVLLLENYSAPYLDGIANKIKENALRYRELYSECYVRIEEYLKSSANTLAIKGIAAASKFTGETIAKIPVISRGQLDENLVEAHSKLNKWNDTRPEQTLKRFISSRETSANIFADYINSIKSIYNDHTELYIDSKGVYLLPTT